jgi:hypothetical protein
MEADRGWVTKFLKPGGWLENMAWCKDCKKREDEGTELYKGEVRLLDLTTLLKTRQDHYVWYCNSGAGAHTMEEDNTWKTERTCDLVLCTACYHSRKGEKTNEEAEGENSDDNQERRRSSRRRRN